MNKNMQIAAICWPQCTRGSKAIDIKSGFPCCRRCGARVFVPSLILPPTGAVSFARILKTASPTAFDGAHSPRMLTRGSTIICSEDIEKVARQWHGVASWTRWAPRKISKETAPIKSKLKSACANFTCIRSKSKKPRLPFCCTEIHKSKHVSWARSRGNAMQCIFASLSLPQDLLKLKVQHTTSRYQESS